MKRKHTIEDAEAKMYGSEPSFDYVGVVDVDDFNSKAWDWFYTNRASKTKKVDWMVSYAKKCLKRPQADLDALGAVDTTEVTHWFSTYAIMAAKGAKLNARILEKLNAEVDRLIVIGNRNVSRNVKTEAVKPSVKDHMKHVINEHCALVEVLLDDAINNGDTFDFKEWAKQIELKAYVAKGILDEMRLSEKLKEISLAFTGKDVDLVEAYSHLSKQQLKKYASFLVIMIRELTAWTEDAKPVRKPRVRKEKPAGKQVAKMKYLKEATKEKLVSLSPVKIVGASEVYLYNAKNRKLTMLVSNSPRGFAVKGCTVINVDETASWTKKVRKPDQVLPTIVTDGKRMVNATVKSLTTKPAALKCRTNAYTLILRAF